MKLSELNHHLTPGVLESVKQAYRQGFDWRECLRRQCLHKDAALLDEIADCLEADVLAKLPTKLSVMRGMASRCRRMVAQWRD